MTDRVIGLDVSRWQDNPYTPQEIDFVKARENGTDFVFIRAGLDNTVDINFADAWRDAKKAGLLRGSYWYYDYRFNAWAQSQKYIGTLDGDYGELPLVVDLEKKRGTKYPNRMAYLVGIKDFLEGLELHISDNHSIMIYLNRGLINYLKPIPEWLLAYDLWIAWYPNAWARLRNRQPKVSPWKRYTLWQHTDRADGHAYGMESRQVDENYFNGSWEELQNYATHISIEPPTPQPPTELTNQEKLDRLWEMHQ